jgi:AraC family transcriptional regulator
MPSIAGLSTASDRLAFVDVEFAKIEVVAFDWPSPAAARLKTDWPMLAYWRGQAGYRSEGYLEGATSHRDAMIGSVFFLPEKQEFATQGTGGPVRAVRCFFEPDYLAIATGTRGAFSQDQLLRGLDMRSTQVRVLMTRLMEEALSPSFGSEALVECLCGALAIEWAREILHLNEEPHGRLPLTRRQLRDVSERLLDSDRSFPSVVELARLAGFGDHHRHFCRAFRKQTGRTISGELRAARIAQAQHLLLNSDLGLKEIAYRLGFSTSANFSTAFQATAGMPPGVFRRTYHNAKLVMKSAWSAK